MKAVCPGRHRICIAGAAAIARCLDPEPAEERVEHWRPKIMHGADPVAVRTDPAGLANRLELVEQGRSLQLPHEHVFIFEQQPEPLSLRAPKRAGQAAETMPLSCPVPMGRLDINPAVQGSSPLNEPPADSPRSCPPPGISQQRRPDPELGPRPALLAERPHPAQPGFGSGPGLGMRAVFATEGASIARRAHRGQQRGIVQRASVGLLPGGD